MDGNWLVLIHHLPPKPDYLRVKVRRRLQRIGAIALKNSVYVLPPTDEALEDFQWLRQEILTEGGEAMILKADFLEGVPNAVLQQMATHDAQRPDPPSERPVGATWVTRTGVKVDRIASAWLIRKWIDPQAVFRFVDGGNASSPPGDIRFDMFEGGFTHIGDRCTFEVLVDHFGVRDRAVTAIGEIVHDVDCKDAKFGRPETQGVASLINGIATTVPDDGERLKVGGSLFDQLYASLGSATA